jgi:hypothetical protein
MHGIKLKTGVNDCHWNINGKCTNKLITRFEHRIFKRNYDSRVNCAVTIIGCYCCAEYIAEGEIEYRFYRAKLKKTTS